MLLSCNQVPSALLSRLSVFKSHISTEDTSYSYRVGFPSEDRLIHLFVKHHLVKKVTIEANKAVPGLFIE